MPSSDDSAVECGYTARAPASTTAVTNLNAQGGSRAPVNSLPVQVAEPGSVHPAAATLFGVCPWLRHVPVLGIALEGFGPSFCFSLGWVDFMTKGVAENTITLSRQPMLVKRFGIDATRYQRLAGIISMGASMKVVMAVLSDAFAILGYRKRWYMLGSCVVSFGFCLGYALLPATPASADTAAAFIFLCTFCRTNVDILSQGFYSRMIQRSPQHGPALISWVYWMVLLGIIVAAVIMGPLSDQNKTRDGVIASAVFHLLPAVVFAFNLYGERTNQEERREDAMLQRQAAAAAAGPRSTGDAVHEPAGDDGCPVKECPLGLKPSDADPVIVVAAAAAVEDENENELHDDLIGYFDVDAVARMSDGDGNGEEEDAAFVDENIWISPCGVVEMNKEVLRSNWKIVIYAVIMTCSVITLACVTILGTKWQLLYACIAVIVACAACAFLTLPLVIAKANMFVYCDMFFYIQLPGALDSFYLASEACVPGGPHFSYTFYNTVGAVIQNVAGMVGVLLFTYVFSKHRYQVVMLVTVTLRVIASVFDLMVVERWNLHIGIPDHAMYICGDTIMYQVCYMLNYMPVLMLLSRVVPHGSESMVYGLMAGIGNLGASMSNTVGSLLMELVWPVDTKSTPCDFSNVRWLIITGHLATPFLIVVAAFVLLPHARVSDALDMHGNVVREAPAAEETAEDSNEASAPPDTRRTSSSKS